MKCGPLIFIDAKKPHQMKLRQLRDEDHEERRGVHDEMVQLVLGVEAGKDKPSNTNSNKHINALNWRLQ